MWSLFYEQEVQTKMFTVECKLCGKFYESKVNRSGICPDCKINARGRTNTRYRDRTYDRIALYVPKGSKEQMKRFAEAAGMSLNQFINEAADKYAKELYESGKVKLDEYGSDTEDLT